MNIIKIVVLNTIVITSIIGASNPTQPISISIQADIPRSSVDAALAENDQEEINLSEFGNLEHHYGSMGTKRLSWYWAEKTSPKEISPYLTIAHEQLIVSFSKDATNGEETYVTERRRTLHLYADTVAGKIMIGKHTTLSFTSENSEQLYTRLRARQLRS